MGREELHGLLGSWRIAMANNSRRKSIMIAKPVKEFRKPVRTGIDGSPWRHKGRRQQSPPEEQEGGHWPD